MLTHKASLQGFKPTHKRVSVVQSGYASCLTLLGLLSSCAVILKLYAVTLAAAPTRGVITFVTFAYPHEPDTFVGHQRWDTNTSRLAIQLMYSSLVRSQSSTPKLHVYTDTPETIPTATTMGTVPNIVVHVRKSSSFPKNPYTESKEKWSAWKALSRAKLDAVEEVLLREKSDVIWIDLDTLVFIDLRQAFIKSKTWVIGFQHGNCEGGCARESFAINPAFDVQGDLWALDAKTIRKVRMFERTQISKLDKLPNYDLQAYISLMLQRKLLSANILLQTILPSHNYGFACSQFQHAESAYAFFIRDGRLMCPIPDASTASHHPGVVSFTSPAFRRLFLSTERITFDQINDPEVRSWFRSWFYPLRYI